ncbi:hypothetical protein ACFCW2_05035 [Qipengyuania sp. DSG2-2]|uniref:hypothetical protein n=1 Tax=Qipengyuania sp. DGS2-2 TaxID=3349631 RepID=UPI0036D38310
MKPDSIRKFDILYWASVLVGIGGALLVWDESVALVNAEMAASGIEDMGAAAMIGSLAFSLLISGVLWMLISVMRVEVVKWVLAIFLAWGAISLVMQMAVTPLTSMITGIASTVFSLAALYFLFQPDAKEWFAEKRNRK